MPRLPELRQHQRLQLTSVSGNSLPERPCSDRSGKELTTTARSRWQGCFATTIVSWCAGPLRLATLWPCGGRDAALIAALEGTGEQVLVVVALSLGTLPVAVMIRIVLAFPTGRLGCRAVVIAVVAYVSTTLLQIPQYMVKPSPMQLTDNDVAAAIVRNSQRIMFLAVAAAVGVVVVRRLREVRPGSRRVLLPLSC